jgi:hypothetical protein
VNITLDENLPERLVAVLADFGHASPPTAHRPSDSAPAL